MKPIVPKLIKDAKNKPEFNFDCLTQIKDIDPNAPRFIEFDWELLRRSLGEARDEMGETDFALMGTVLAEFMRWIVKGNRLDLIGRRAVALAWVVNPELLEGESLRKLAKRVMCLPVRLHQLSGEASREFGVRNRGQAQASNWKPK